MSKTIKPPVSDYAPKSPAVAADMRLTTVTVGAVDAIGERAATEIEAVANELAALTKVTCDQLSALAAAIRGQTQIAAKMIGDFCMQNSETLSTIQGLNLKITPPKAATNGDGGEPIPKFLTGEQDAQETFHE